MAHFLVFFHSTKRATVAWAFSFILLLPPPPQHSRQSAHFSSILNKPEFLFWFTVGWLFLVSKAIICLSLLLLFPLFSSFFCLLFGNHHHLIDYQGRRRRRWGRRGPVTVNCLLLLFDDDDDDVDGAFAFAPLLVLFSFFPPQPSVYWSKKKKELLLYRHLHKSCKYVYIFYIFHWCANCEYNNRFVNYPPFLFLPFKDPFYYFPTHIFTPSSVLFGLINQ